MITGGGVCGETRTMGLMVSDDEHAPTVIEKKYVPGLRLLMVPEELVPDTLPLGLPLMVQFSGEGRLTKETLPVILGHMGWVTTSISGGDGEFVTFTVMMSELTVLHELPETNTWYCVVV